MAGNIPTYEASVSPEPLPTPYDQTRVTPDAFGAGTGEVLQQGAGFLAEEARKAKADADSTAKIMTVGAAENLMNTLVLDPKSGYASLKGKDALDQRDPTLNKLKDGLDKIGTSLANDEQRRFFEHYSSNLYDQAVKHVYVHEGEQRENMSRAAATGTVDQVIQKMRLHIGTAELGSDVELLNAIATTEGQRRFGNNAAAIQSIVVPVMQKAARDTMEAASVADPAVAVQTFAMLKPYLLTDEHHYATIVDAIQQKQAVNQQAAQVVSGAVTTVTLPGGQQIPQVDAGKLAASILALPDGPRRDDVIKAIEQRQGVLDKVWRQVSAQVAARAETKGMDQDGNFSLNRVDVGDRVWLQQNDPDALKNLKLLENREDSRAAALQRLEEAAAKREQQATSSENYGAAFNWLNTPGNRKQIFGMSREEFAKSLNNPELYPGGMSTERRIQALGQFDKIIKEGTVAQSVVNRIHRETLEKMFPGAGSESKKNRDKYASDLQDLIDAFAASHKGEVDEGKLRDYAEHEMASRPADGAVGRFFGYSPGRYIVPDAAALRASRAQPTATAQAIPPQPTKASLVAPTPIRTDAEFNALPSGTEFVAPDGKVRRKP